MADGPSFFALLKKSLQRDTILKMKRHKPELVSPAGNWPSLIAAVENGADSVYFGLKGFNMRSLAANFDILELKKIMKFLHDHKKKGYLVLNVVVSERTTHYKKDLEESENDQGRCNSFMGYGGFLYG